MNRECSHRTDHNNDRCNDGERNPQNRRKDRHAGQYHEEAGDVTEVHTRDQSPNKIRFFHEEQWARL